VWTLEIARVSPSLPLGGGDEDVGDGNGNYNGGGGDD